MVRLISDETISMSLIYSTAGKARKIKKALLKPLQMFTKLKWVFALINIRMRRRRKNDVKI